MAIVLTRFWRKMTCNTKSADQGRRFAKEHLMKQQNRQSGVLDFNHGWRFSERDYSVLPAGRTHNDIYHFSKAGGAKGPAQLTFPDSDWDRVTLPHDWVTHHGFSQQAIMNHGYQERGIGWYRNLFNLEQEDREKQILLEFEGLSAPAQIYVNGQLMYRNQSGYQSFCVDVTEQVHFGDCPNLVAVRIDASAWEGWWYEGAGIYRPVWLVKKPAVHIAYDGQWVRPQRLDQRGWQVEVQTELENSFELQQCVEIQTELLTPKGTVLCSKREKLKIEGFGNETVMETFFVEEPDLWSPEEPNLYLCRTTVLGEGEPDVLTTEFGFRSIKLDPDTGFWLNGENRKLRGFCCHQDHAGLGTAVPYAVKEYRIGRLKALGADAYRCAHNTDPEIMEICDRMGMIVMEENRNFSTADEDLRRLEQLVRHARNHPSVCFYSIFNEEPLQAAARGCRMAKRMQAVIKALDPDRPVLGAFNGGYLEPGGAASGLEVVGINYNQGAYDKFHAQYPNTPLIASETSSSYAVRGEYQTNMEKNIIGSLDEDCAPWGATGRDTWKTVMERPFVAGSFAWTGFDYRGEPTPCVWPSVASFFGILDSCGFPKATAYLYETLYRKEPVIHLERCSREEARVDTEVTFAVMTNCPQIRLFHNEVLVEEGTVPPFDMKCVTLADGAGVWKAQGLRGGVVCCEHQMRVHEKVAALRLEASKPVLCGDGLDAVVVNVYAVDQNGTFCPDAEQLVTFTVSHNGIIRGVGNGNPNSHEPDAADFRKLFHGCAQVIVSKEGTEALTLEARAEGLTGAELELHDSGEMQIPRAPALERIPVEGWSLYHRLFEQMPPADFRQAENDMNSLEPISFEGSPQSLLSGQIGKYALLRTELEAGSVPMGASIFFGAILGKAWVYLDGVLLAEKSHGKEESLAVQLPLDCKGGSLTVILQNQDEDWQQCGILTPVFLQK